MSNDTEQVTSPDEADEMPGLDESSGHGSVGDQIVRPADVVVATVDHPSIADAPESGGGSASGDHTEED